MLTKTTLNIFYEEPNPDRWFKYDRYPRNIIRRIIRGKARPGSMEMIALQLLEGLKELDIPFRFNDYKYAKQNPNELIGVIGKDHLIFNNTFKNPILFGAGIFSHPLSAPNLLDDYPNIKKILVPGPWMEKMFSSYYGQKVQAWPVGIDSKKWSDVSQEKKTIDFLIYDKLWENDIAREANFLTKITSSLKDKNLSYRIIKYGNYDQNELFELIKISKAAIFLSIHETQGFAYQQILSTNTPILAWDMEDFWFDPNFYPERVQFKPVSSVPYWEDKCGIKFKDAKDFENKLDLFLSQLNKNEYSPREFILENLSLKKCALEYYNIYTSIASTLKKH